MDDEYIKREDAIKHLRGACIAKYPLSFSYGIFASADEISKLPTADVAPKSEVEKIIYKLECLLCHATGSKLSKYTYDLRTMETAVTDYINESYDEGYRDAKSEVAREIFEEIDKIRTMEKCFQRVNVFYDTGREYEELKKKYTEGEE